MGEKLMKMTYIVKSVNTDEDQSNKITDTQTLPLYMRIHLFIGWIW